MFILIIEYNIGINSKVGCLYMQLEMLGLSSAKIKQFKKKEIDTVEDLVARQPRKYFNFLEEKGFQEAENRKAQFMKLRIHSYYTKAKNLMVSVTSEKTGEKGLATFFGGAYLAKQFENQDVIYVGGYVSNKGTHIYNSYLITPIQWSFQESDIRGIKPIYSRIQNMSEAYYEKAVKLALQQMPKEEYLENQIVEHFQLMSHMQAINEIHLPTSVQSLLNARRRMRFDELFRFNYELFRLDKNKVQESQFSIPKMAKTKIFMESLPFELTDGQRKVLRELSMNIRKGKFIDALVMGDVGCGKTIVALLLMVSQIENGYQGCIVAPTQVLATQHFQEAKKYLEPLGINVGFIYGGMKKRERNKLLKGLANNDIQLLIGTHACFSNDVIFKNLSMIVIDEEQRFGVKQRDKMREKVTEGVHTISMSATPIPRTLAMTLYGEHVTIHTIESVPNGRKPVKISLVPNTNHTYDKIKEALDRQEQIYFVCPLIEESDSEQTKDVKSVDEIYADVCNAFPGVNVDFINGHMDDSEIEERLGAFSRNETQILVSTTIIEVGVNVPNATIMVIQNAERFGASQIWQLKGRVGRGDKPSETFLVSEPKTQESLQKLSMLCVAKNGFEVADMDLKLRGGGSLLGNQQSGLNKYLNLIIKNEPLNQEIRKFVSEIMKDPKRLKRYDRFFKYQSELEEV